MRLIGYARVSTVQQNLGRQLGASAGRHVQDHRSKRRRPARNVKGRPERSGGHSKASSLCVQALVPYRPGGIKW